MGEAPPRNNSLPASDAATPGSSPGEAEQQGQLSEGNDVKGNGEGKTPAPTLQRAGPYVRSAPEVIINVELY